MAMRLSFKKPVITSGNTDFAILLNKDTFEPDLQGKLCKQKCVVYGPANRSRSAATPLLEHRQLNFVLPRSAEIVENAMVHNGGGGGGEGGGHTSKARHPGGGGEEGEKGGGATILKQLSHSFWPKMDCPKLDWPKTVSAGGASSRPEQMWRDNKLGSCGCV